MSANENDGRSPQLGKEWVNKSVSSGTLRFEDLIPRFEEVLDGAAVEYERPTAVDILLAGSELSEAQWVEVSYYLNEELFDLLDSIAPDGTSFGAHQGDGADYGFWSVEDGDCY